MNMLALFSCEQSTELFYLGYWERIKIRDQSDVKSPK